MALAEIRKVGENYILDFRKRTVPINLRNLRQSLGRNVSIRVLEERINRWLEQHTEPGEILQLHIFTEDPPYIKIGRFYAANVPDGIPPDWWVEDTD